MVNSHTHMKCKYCKEVAVKKYHNTYYPYCGNCHRTPDYEKVYTCGYCGVSEPESRMSTEWTCQACAERLDVYEPTAKDLEDLKAFIAKLQGTVSPLNDA